MRASGVSSLSVPALTAADLVWGGVASLAAGAPPGTALDLHARTKPLPPGGCSLGTTPASTDETISACRSNTIKSPSRLSQRGQSLGGKLGLARCLPLGRQRARRLRTDVDTLTCLCRSPHAKTDRLSSTRRGSTRRGEATRNRDRPSSLRKPGAETRALTAPLDVASDAGLKRATWHPPPPRLGGANPRHALPPGATPQGVRAAPMHLRRSPSRDAVQHLPRSLRAWHRRAAHPQYLRT